MPARRRGATTAALRPGEISVAIRVELLRNVLQQDCIYLPMDPLYR